MSVTQPYGPPYGPAPKRPVRWGLIFALVAGGLVVLCLAGVALVFGLTGREIEPAGAAAESYVEAVIAGDDARALKYVCTGSNAKSSHDDFTRYVRGKEVSDHRVVDTNVTLRNLSWRATVHMELTISNGSEEPLTLPLAKEHGEWKVCST
jgi:hypothetical protein